MGEIRHEPGVGSARSSLRFVVPALVLAGLLAGGWWWEAGRHGRGFDVFKWPEWVKSAMSTSREPVNSPPKPEIPVPAVVPAPAPQSVSSSPAASVNPPVLTAQNATIPPDTPVAGNSVAANSTAAPNNPVPTPIPAPNATPTPTQATLTLEFAGDSWVGGTDGEGKEVISKKYKAGDKMSLDVTPPLRVTIGNAGKVKGSFRGQALDLSVRNQNDIAKLTLE